MKLNPDKDKLKIIESISTIALVLTLMAYFLELKLLYIASSALIILNFVAYRISFWIIQGWFYLAQILGEYLSRLVLIVFFYIVLTPISLVYRMFNGDVFDLKPGKDSYFHDREEIFDKTYFERIW